MTGTEDGHSSGCRHCAQPAGAASPAAAAAALSDQLAALGVRGEPSARTTRLRQLLQEPRCLQGPSCYDGISARLVERANFPFTFMSGFCASAARIGGPDTGLLSFGEMLASVHSVMEGTRGIPIIADGDTGYGNAVSVKRTVRAYASAGIAGIQLEDQVSPKSCGHVGNKAVVSREEAVARVRAACDARDEGRDILIVARTDARQAESLEEALWRVRAFADAGADAIIADGLASVEEMQAICAAAGPRVFKMANLIEGGRTPVLPPEELYKIGYNLVIYSVSLLAVSVRAMENALEGLALGRCPSGPGMPTFQELQAAVGWPEYNAEEARYAVKPHACTRCLSSKKGRMFASLSMRKDHLEAAAAAAAAGADTEEDED